MESSRGGSRRRQQLTDEKTDPTHLRDFLLVNEDDAGRTSLAGLTLSAVLSNEKRPTPAQPNRTLLDIIRDDPNGGFKDNKKSWKSFRDKLRRRRTGTPWTSSVPIPTSDVPMHNNNRMIMRGTSTQYSNTPDVNSDDPTLETTYPELPSPGSSSAFDSRENRAELNSVQSNRAMMLRRNSSRVVSATREGHLDHAINRDRSFNSGDNNAELMEEMVESPEESEEGVEETEEEPTAEVAAAGGEQPVRMSLMSLLAETDREMGLDGSTYMMEEEEEEEEVEEEGGGADYNNCCVCMVRHKGAAFIPCGHTFCRLCSRELWVQRACDIPRGKPHQWWPDTVTPYYTTVIFKNVG
ncbi:hypothetical protein F0562_002304 [Nyssa sinensis]|uniref:RING-type domain-containing protein n=1 Tax=Nyssa sinensis TaxID=561372 RepID=A0A5J5C9A6_9ASTE|nr:hypothetical protein F0562_002304 [Nyssa sinensis]